MMHKTGRISRLTAIGGPSHSRSICGSTGVDFAGTAGGGATELEVIDCFALV